MPNNWTEVYSKAKKEFEVCQTWENQSRNNFRNDWAFAHGDSVNNAQWPDTLRQMRDSEQRPYLTINKARQHCLLIVNDTKENKPGIKYMPTGGGATFEAAQVWNGLARRIESQSTAQAIYDKAMNFAVMGGWGYWRVVTDYVDSDSFDQDIYIRPIEDPLCVYCDPSAKQPDKLDKKYAFLFEDLAKEDAETKYSKYKDKFSTTALDNSGGWITDDKVRIAEYYKIITTSDRIAQTESGILRRSDAGKELWATVENDPNVKKRNTDRKQVMWYLIIGNEVVEEKPWAGKYVPIISVIPEEVVVGGRMDRPSHTRYLTDPQRMYNFWSSAGVEYGALQSKSPFIGSVQAIEGFETYWENSNKENPALLPYNAYDDLGQPLQPPQRQQPPQAAPVAITGMQIAGQEMEMASGQYAPAMGQPDNSRTGAAIGERQRQGDKATYHYIDALAIAVKATGVIILDLVPHIYDTPRVMMALAEDGQSFEVTIDPEAQQLLQQQLNHEQDVVSQTLNPTKGRFDVQAEVGPGYATRREEAFHSYTTLLTQAPQFASLLGDLMLKAADFPFADEAAQRIRRMIPPQALGKGPTQNEQQLQQQVQGLTATLQKLNEQLAVEKIKSKNKAEQKEVDIFNAQTERMRAAGSVAKDGMDVAQATRQMEFDFHHSNLELAAQAAGNDLQTQTTNAPQALPQTQPVPRKARDGKYYIPDPNRAGKYLRLD